MTVQIITRRLTVRPVALFTLTLTTLLLVSLIASASLVTPSTAAQAVEASPIAAPLSGEVFACATPVDGQLRYVAEPNCALDETLVSFNTLDGVPEAVILCAATIADPVRRATDAHACLTDLVVLTVPSLTTETRFCIDERDLFRLPQDGACAVGTAHELIIPAGPAVTATPTATAAPSATIAASPESTPTLPAASPPTATPTPVSVATAGFRTAANQPPVPRNRRLSTLEDSPSFLITLFATDADGNAITFSRTSAPSKGGVGSIFGTSCTGAVPNTCTAKIRYRPSRNEFGYDSFAYRASDGMSSATATITIRINGVNDAPHFIKGPDVTTVEDVAITQRWAPLTSEGPANERTQSLNFVILSNSNPALFATQPAVSPSGRLSYVPAAEVAGTATITLQLHDSGGTANGGDNTSAIASFLITISPANDEPSFTAGADVTVGEDSGAYSAPWASNMSPGPPDESGQATRFVASTDDLTLFAVRPRIDPSGVLTFTPAPDANGTAVIRVRIRDDGSTSNPGDHYQSSPAYLLTITISAVNDEPGFTAGADVTVAEDSGAYHAAWATGIIPGAANESSQSLTFEITGNTNVGLFSSPPAIAADGALQFTPTANASGSATIDVRLTDDGGTADGGDDTSATQSVTITVTAVNDAPVNTVPGAQAVYEDTALVFNAGNGNQISIADVDAGSNTVQVTLSVAQGTLSLSGVTGLTFSVGDGTQDLTMTFAGTIADSNAALNGLSYQGNLNSNTSQSAETLSIVTDDLGNAGAGGSQSDSDTVGITVIAVNDEPSFDLPASPNQTVVEDSPAQTVAGFATNISAGPADESGQTLTFTVSNDTNTLFSAQPAINSATGDLTFTPAAGQLGTATVTVVLSDDGGTANVGDDTSASQSFTISVIPANSPPGAVSQSVTTDEDTATTITLGGSDAEGTAVTFAIGTAPSHGTLGAIGAVLCSGATPNVCSADVTYTPDADYTGPDSFTFTVNDGSTDSAAATVSITINPVNDAPVLGGVEAGSLSYMENDPATIITSTLTVTDIDSANLIGATVAITANFAAGQDALSFVNTAAITGSYNTGTGVLTLTGSASLADYLAALRSVTYVNISDNPSTATRTISFQVSDSAATSTAVTRSITVSAVNDEPLLAGIEAGALAYIENDPATALTSSLTVTDVDSVTLSGATVAITANFAAGEDVLSFTSQSGITGSYNAAIGVLTLSGSASPANYQTALRTVGYANTSDNPSTATRTVSFQVDDGAAQSTVAIRDVTVIAVNDAPVLTGTKNYSANANLQIAVPDGPSDLLVGWSDPDGPGAISIDPGSVSTSTPTGAAITGVDNTTGAFTFDPPAGATGDVTFTYRVCDTAVPTPACSADTTVTVAVSGPVIWFVDDSALAGGVGTLARPFQTVSAAGTAIGANTAHRIFLFTGSYADGRALNASEWLIGQGVTGFASFDALMSITPPTTTIARPTIGSGTVTIQNTVTLNSSVTIKSIAIASTTATGVTDPAGAITGVSVDQTTITTTTGTALSLSDTTGTIAFANVSKNGAGTGISLTNVGAGVTIPAGTIENATTGGIAIDGSNGAFSYGGSVSVGAGQVVRVQNRTGGTATFAGSVTATAGSTGLLLSNNDTGAGGVIQFTGAVSITNSTGAAVTVQNSNSGTTSFANLAVTNSASNQTGLLATANSGGALNIATGSINGGSSSAVDIDTTALGITLTRIDSSGGSATGLILETTTGSFTVNGNGTNTALGGDGSGGIIANKTGADGATATGIGVYLSSASNVTLRRMTINGTNQNFGIRGVGVTNFTLEYATVSGANGTDAGLDEGSVNFDNLTGSAAITSSLIEGGLEDNLNVVNTAGTLNRLTITGSTFGFNNAVSGNNNILIEAQNAGTTLNFTLQTSTIKGARADWLNASANSSSSMDAVVTGNSFDNLGANANPGAAAGGNRIVLGAIGTLTYDINGNALKGSKGGAIFVRSSGTFSGLTGTASGRVRNNIIGVAATANSGSSEGSGISITGDGGSDHTAAVTNNQIYQYNNHGIVVTLGDEINDGSVFNITVTGNTVNSPGSLFSDFNAIHLNSGTVAATDNFTACVDIGGAGGLANSIANGGSGAINPNNVDVRLRQRQSTTVRLPGYAGANNDNTAVQVYLTGRNVTRAQPDGAAAANTVPTGGGFVNSVGGVGCAQPSAAIADPIFAATEGTTAQAGVVDRRQLFAGLR